MKKLNFKYILLLSLLGISGLSMTGCARTYHSSPKQMRGYYISSYQKKPLSTPIMFHITKHDASSIVMPYNRTKIAYRAIRNQELQLYTNGLQDAYSTPNRKNTHHIIQDRNILKSLSKNFSKNKSTKTKRFRVLEDNLQSKRNIHIINVKYLHHRYYMKGHIYSQRSYIIHNKVQEKKYLHHVDSMNKFKFNKHHQLCIVVQSPQQHMHTRLFLLHKLSNHEAHAYLNRGQIEQ